MADTIAFLTKRGIPVMAHVGLTPQAVNALGQHGTDERRTFSPDDLEVAIPRLSKRMHF